MQRATSIVCRYFSCVAGALGALLSSTCAPPDGVAVSLAARHVYHYDLRCESFPQVGE